MMPQWSAGVKFHRGQLSSWQAPGSPFRVKDRACSFGSGLLGCYAPTDVPMVLSGEHVAQIRALCPFMQAMHADIPRLKAFQS